jgi:hypothetical protein
VRDPFSRLVNILSHDQGAQIRHRGGNQTTR